MAIPRSNTTVTLTEASVDLSTVPQERAATFRETMGSFACLLMSAKLQCDQPLREFMIIFCITSGLTLISNAFRYQYKRRLQLETARATATAEQVGAHNGTNTGYPTQLDDALRQRDILQDTQRILNYLERSKGFLEAFGLLWLFFGSAWVLSCKTCQTTAPSLYYWCVTWIVYGYIFICAPLIFFSALVCIVPAIFVIVKQIKQVKLRRAARKILKTIPLVSYQTVYEEKYGARSEHELGSGSTIDSNIDCCSICLAGFKWKERVRKLRCKHYFHHQCGDKWLVMHGTCPLCLTSINEPQN